MSSSILAFLFDDTFMYANDSYDMQIFYHYHTDHERPMIQAEALCTLAELAWALPQSCVDICRGCLDLVVAAMEHHSSVS